MNLKKIKFTDYFLYRVKTRGFNLKQAEEIIRYSQESYIDTETEHRVVVGKDSGIMVVIPLEENSDKITPITIHATNRKQITFRLKTKRYRYGWS